MKICPILITLAFISLTACNNSPAPPPASSAPSKPADGVQQKLQQYSGASGTDCGRLEVHASAEQSKAASDCALQASQGKRPFYVAYDMPGMTIGVAGNAEGKLFTAQSQEGGSVTSGDCPSQLRLAASGRVTCFAPGDMGSMGTGHMAVPPGMPDPHALPKKN